MRNFLTRHFGQACKFLSEKINEGNITCAVEDYRPRVHEASLLLHPPDNDWRSLAIWAAGRLTGIEVNPLHCSLAYCLTDYPIYVDYTMDGVIVADNPYRDVTGYIKFEILEPRKRSITNRLIQFRSLGTQIDPLAAYSFLFNRQPDIMVCTSFINWLLYMNPGYANIKDLCDIVLQAEVGRIIYHEGIYTTRTVPKMPLIG